MVSIADRVAVIGMGCTKFGERWDQSGDDMLIDACYEAFEDAKVEPEAIQAGWVAVTVGLQGAVLGEPLKLRVPITRVENACAGGTDAFRNGCYAVALGVYDVVLVAGVEKMKDMGVSGLAGATKPGPSSEVQPGLQPPSLFAMRALRYCHQYGYSVEQLKRTLANIVVESHDSGYLNPRAHFRRRLTIEQVLNAPLIAYPLGLFDCCAVSDGAAAAIIVPREMAKKYRDDYISVKTTNIGTGPGATRMQDDFIHFDENRFTAAQAYRDAGIKNPREEVDLAVVHDCFSVNQLITMEDLGFSQEGKAPEDVDSGFFTKQGGLPINTDGGLKCFGHPTAASGLRMIYEIYKQLQGKPELPERQIKDAKTGLTHNLGGLNPGSLTCGISVFARSED